MFCFEIRFAKKNAIVKYAAIWNLIIGVFFLSSSQSDMASIGWFLQGEPAWLFQMLVKDVYTTDNEKKNGELVVRFAEDANWSCREEISDSVGFRQLKVNGNWSGLWKTWVKQLVCELAWHQEIKPFAPRSSKKNCIRAASSLSATVVMYVFVSVSISRI